MAEPEEIIIHYPELEATPEGEEPQFIHLTTEAERLKVRIQIVDASRLDPARSAKQAADDLALIRHVSEKEARLRAEISETQERNRIARERAAMNAQPRGPTPAAMATPGFQLYSGLQMLEAAWQQASPKERAEFLASKKEPPAPPVK